MGAGEVLSEFDANNFPAIRARNLDSIPKLLLTIPGNFDLGATEGAARG
jgi:hypothetical protein